MWWRQLDSALALGQSEWRFVHGAPTGSICIASPGHYTGAPISSICIASPGHSLNMQIQAWTRNCGCGTQARRLLIRRL